MCRHRQSERERERERGKQNTAMAISGRWSLAPWPRAGQCDETKSVNCGACAHVIVSARPGETSWWSAAFPVTLWRLVHVLSAAFVARLLTNDFLVVGDRDVIT